MKLLSQKSRIAAALFGSAVLAFAPSAFAQSRYQQTNLVSDVPGLAPVTDANLVNPWGLSRSGTSAWWTANQGSGTSTLYNGLGVKQALVVTVPNGDGSAEASTPTGTVFSGSSDFQVGLPGTNQPARFLFVTEEGTISGWNPGANPTVAITKVNNLGKAVYKGLALGQINGANFLYAANFHTGKVEVYDKAFAPVDLGPKAFVDKTIPCHFAPFNVQAIGDKIFVAYAKQDYEKIDEIAGPAKGYVTVFTTSGELVMRLQHGSWMNAPWGLVQAPADFGVASGLILVGQFGSGKIATFDPTTGKFQGYLRTGTGKHGEVLQIDGLWALSFGNGANAGPLTTLYFTAGIEDEAHGLFGSITPVADPAP